VDAAAHFGAEDVVDEAVLGDAAEALESGRGDDRIEVVPIAGDLSPSTGNPGLDALPQLFWSSLPQLVWRSRHDLKRSGPWSRRYTS